LVANFCRAPKKDFRDAVVAARTAFPNWSKQSAYLERQLRVVLVSTTKPLPALTFSEIIATSDLPAGVINLLAGDRAELAPHIASHMDVNAIVDGSGDAKLGAQLQRGEEAENPYWILDTVEMKTAWHPIGL
jgi:acyl-CoA reductase-like NAD-dependent aldehyde dehydrogenase